MNSKEIKLIGDTITIIKQQNRILKLREDEVKNEGYLEKRIFQK
ncbi:MAG: hypothetical protein AB8F94_02245 [Saprospiraceae bacterium]